MSGLTTSMAAHLTRAEVYSNEIKEILQEQLYAQQWVKWLSGFPDGDEFLIPSVGQMEVQDYAENQAVRYTGLDTGEFRFHISEYKQGGTYVTKKVRQDAWLMSQVEPTLVPRMQRALAEQMEMDVLSIGPRAQTSNNANAINGGNHRLVASGTNRVVTVEDIAKVKYALRKANVPGQNLIGIVDPSVGYAFETQTGLVNPTFNPMWEGVVKDGFVGDMQFKFNVLGVDIYVSDKLFALTAAEATIGASAGDVCNIFFSAVPDVLPLIGAIRQSPEVDSEYNKDRQRDEYVVTCRYGFAFYRPENFVTLISDTDQIYV